MTTDPASESASPSVSSNPRRRDLIAVVLTGAVAGAGAGAYLNWSWWEIGHRPMVIILPAVIVVSGGLVSIIRRVVARRIGLVLVAIGLGMLGGQLVGPAREPLIHQTGGTMTLRLESPVGAVLTGPVECDGVASQTEFLVQGAPDLAAAEVALPDAVFAQLGDRWAFPRDPQRTDRVRLEIGVTTGIAPDSGKAQSRVGMEATQVSTLVSRFSNEGGEIRFGSLVAHDGPGYSGKSMDLAGTFSWTCGAPPP